MSVSFSFPTRCLLLGLAIVSCLFFSPKWFSPLAVWVHFPALLLLLRYGNRWWWLASYAGLTAASVVAQAGVFPMPLTALVPFMLVANLIALLPFLVDRYTHARLPVWAGTLVFPVAATLLDAFAANGPQGTWGNQAYTQFPFTPLIQFTAVTGIFGVSFLYYWFAASVAAAVRPRQAIRRLLPWATVFCLVLGYGSYRMLSPTPGGEEVRLAAVQLNNHELYETMYSAAFEGTIQLPESFDQTDPLVSEVGNAMMAFMSEPEAERFQPVHRATEEFQQQLLTLCGRAAEEGAQIVSLAEGIVPTTKERATALRAAAARAADQHDIVLLYATAVFHPDKVGKADKFIENKVITFGPNGEVLNEYFKNIPVMGIEPSFPGDGSVPAVATPFGTISPLICYDADHPQLVAQTSSNGTGLMVVPTGDWSAIAPFHTYMAAVRCIENGVGMLKSTNQGLSAIINSRGELVESANLGAEQHVLHGMLPLRSIRTPYAQTAPLFLVLLRGLLVCLVVLLVVGWVRDRSRRSVSPPLTEGSVG